MGDFARKTARVMASTLGTVAAILHIQTDCCGVGGIEAQIAAGGEEYSSSDESSLFVVGDRQPKHRSSSRPSEHVNIVQDSRRSTPEKIKRKAEAGAKGEDASRTGPGRATSRVSNKKFSQSVGGIRGRGSRKGRRREGGDQSQTSQASAFSFLSSGLKMLASKGAQALGLKRISSRSAMDSTADDCSELSGFDGPCDSRTEYAEPTRPELHWCRVRMYVQRVRGEGPNLAGTVTYRAARRIQVLARAKVARKKVVEQRVLAYEARRYGEEVRLRRRRREAEARKFYKQACKEEGRRIFDWSVKCFLQPRAAIDLQRVWRGHRARECLAAYLKWLENKARRRREYERYLAALAAQRKTEDPYNDQVVNTTHRQGNKYQSKATQRIKYSANFPMMPWKVKRRVWGRVEFSHTGWEPPYKVEDPPSMHNHVTVPPRGSSSGVRTLKILLPPRSERDRRSLTENKTAWAGIPVGITKLRPPTERLGPPPRPGTITADLLTPKRLGGDDEVQLGKIATKYNWIPAPLVGKTKLLQAPLKSR